MARNKKSIRRQRIDTLIDAHVALRRAARNPGAKCNRRRPADGHESAGAMPALSLPKDCDNESTSSPTEPEAALRFYPTNW
jgi:hypothetical protein